MEGGAQAEQMPTQAEAQQEAALCPPSSSGGIKNYEIIKPIGKGKFAVVYRAKRLSDGETGGCVCAYYLNYTDLGCRAGSGLWRVQWP